MDQKSQEMLEEILKRDKTSLDEVQTAFLRARRSYLNDEQRARFSDLLEGLDEAPKKKAKKEEVE